MNTPTPPDAPTPKEFTQLACGARVERLHANLTAASIYAACSDAHAGLRIIDLLITLRQATRSQVRLGALRRGFADRPFQCIEINRVLASYLMPVPPIKGRDNAANAERAERARWIVPARAALAVFLNTVVVQGDRHNGELFYLKDPTVSADTTR